MSGSIFGIHLSYSPIRARNRSRSKRNFTAIDEVKILSSYVTGKVNFYWNSLQKVQVYLVWTAFSLVAANSPLAKLIFQQFLCLMTQAVSRLFQVDSFQLWRKNRWKRLKHLLQKYFKVTIVLVFHFIVMFSKYGSFQRLLTAFLIN